MTVIQTPQWFDKDEDGTFAIRCDFIFPPIPTRAFDWCASYDGEEPDDDGNMATGFGKTPLQAVNDLKDNYPKD